MSLLRIGLVVAVWQVSATAGCPRNREGDAERDPSLGDTSRTGDTNPEEFAVNGSSFADRLVDEMDALELTDSAGDRKCGERECGRPIPCQNSKDCPEDRVCAADGGICVQCVGDEDCPQEESCGSDHECHTSVPCISDIECKGLALICDKDAGLCVECKQSSHCSDGEFCDSGYCVPIVCVPGAKWCSGADAVGCVLDGSAALVRETCDGEYYCQNGECLKLACFPGSEFCDGDVYGVCSADGTRVQTEDDCSAKNMHCSDGGCTMSVCPRDEGFCQDDRTAAHCSGDGMSYEVVPCDEGHSCEAGECHEWLCIPSKPFCDGNVVKQCNAKGSGVDAETPCVAGICVDGLCKPAICDPGSSLCNGASVVECDASGTSQQVSQVCGQDEHCAQDGSSAHCQPHVCSPGQLVCDGTYLMQCDDLGTAEAFVMDCADDQKVCSGGACAEVPALGTVVNPAPSCAAILQDGASKGNGLYWLLEDGGTEVFCDMTSDGGGWRLILGPGNPTNQCDLWSVAPVGAVELECGTDHLQLDCESDSCAISAVMEISPSVTAVRYLGEVFSSGGTDTGLWMGPSPGVPLPTFDDAHKACVPKGCCELNGPVSEMVVFSQQDVHKLGWYVWSDWGNKCGGWAGFWHLEEVWTR